MLSPRKVIRQVARGMIGSAWEPGDRSQSVDATRCPGDDEPPDIDDARMRQVEARELTEPCVDKLVVDPREV
jgi:hypothetical protein